jgi:uncharacterized membrane protein YtjA (UPF0391 family)
MARDHRRALQTIGRQPPDTRRAQAGTRFAMEMWRSKTLPTSLAAGVKDETSTDITERIITMLHYTIVFLVISLIAAVLGFGGVAGAAAGIAKVCFFLFLALFVLSLAFGGRFTKKV